MFQCRCMEMLEYDIVLAHGPAMPVQVTVVYLYMDMVSQWLAVWSLVTSVCALWNVFIMKHCVNGLNIQLHVLHTCM